MSSVLKTDDDSHHVIDIPENVHGHEQAAGNTDDEKEWEDEASDNDDDCAQDKDVVQKPSCCNKTGVLAQVAIALNICQCMLLLATYNCEDGMTEERVQNASRLLRTFRRLEFLVTVSGMCLLARSTAAPPAVWPCVPLKRSFTPWLLMLAGMLTLFAEARFIEEDELSSLLPVCRSVVTMSFGAQWLYLQWHSHASCDGEEITSDNAAQSLKSRFAVSLGKDSRKYMFVYILAEAASILTIAVCHLFLRIIIVTSLEDVAYLKVHLSIVPLGLAIRMWRFFQLGQTPTASTWILDIVLDTFVFTWHAVVAGSSGQQGNSLAVNIQLTYAVITFLPFWRSIIVAPMAYAAFCIAAWQADKLVVAEVVMLGVGLSINLIAKKMIENSKYQTFLLLEEKAQQALDEKVLRCQAEFEKDYVLSSSKRKHGMPEQSPPTAQCTKSAKGATWHCQASEEVDRKAASLCSAPTLLCRKNGKNTAPAKDPNCLPKDAMVWLEGEALPRELGTVQAGQRVLCYDRLGGSAKHASVAQLEEISGSTLWTKITLADGTSMKMTVDHPVQPVPSESRDHEKAVGPWNGMKIVNAGDLRAGDDSLLVLKVVPVRVQTTEVYEESAPRIAVSVNQPERHAIFVAQGGQPYGPVRSMAVESSGIPRLPPISMGANKTFLDIQQGCDDDSNVQYECNSAPASLHGVQAVTYSHCRTEYERITLISEASYNVQSMSSGSVSSFSQQSSANGGDQVIINMAGGDCVFDMTASLDESGENTVALSSVLAVRASGVCSIGSTTHATSNCKPCAFDNRRQFFGTKACIKGSLCEFCHEPHAKEIKKAKRKVTRQAAAKRRRDAWQEAHGIIDDSEVLEVPETLVSL